VSQSNQSQALSLRNRKMRRARQILQTLTPWSAGLVISEAGIYVSSESGQAAFVSTGAGTTAGSSPTGQVFTDAGGVSWERVDIASLLQFLNTYLNGGIPSP
jgi:hypothetical protein